MSEETVRISDAALEALFNETLYCIEEVGNIHIVISQTLEFEGSADHVFLENVLNAVKVSLDKVKVTNIHSENFKLPTEGVCLIFGVTAFEAGFKSVDATKYEIFELDELKILEVDKLSQISLDVNKKKALWLALKRIFNV